MDQIAKAKFQIKETLANVSEGSVMEPQEKDSIGMRLTDLDVLGELYQTQQGSVFTPLELLKLDLEPPLRGHDIPKDTKLQILKGVQDAQTSSDLGVPCGLCLHVCLLHIRGTHQQSVREPEGLWKTAGGSVPATPEHPVVVKMFPSTDSRAVL